MLWRADKTNLLNISRLGSVNWPGMDLNSIDPFKVEASPVLDAVIHEKLFPDSEEGECPEYSSRRQNGLRVADELEALFDINIRLGRLRVKEHKNTGIP